MAQKWLVAPPFRPPISPQQQQQENQAFRDLMTLGRDMDRYNWVGATQRFLASNPDFFYRLSPREQDRLMDMLEIKQRLTNRPRPPRLPQGAGPIQSDPFPSTLRGPRSTGMPSTVRGLLSWGS